MPPAGLAQTAVAFTEKRRKLRPYAPFANQSNRFTRASELAYAQTTLALMLQNGTLIAHFAEVDFKA